jgi:hypothetical protein
VPLCLCPFEPLHQPAQSLGIQMPRKRNSTKEYVRIYKLFMQNKANFRAIIISVSSFITSKYEILSAGSDQKTNPIQTQSKPIKVNFTCSEV